MKVRPASVYRNVILGFVVFFVVYSFYRIIIYDDGSHEKVHRRQKHLYLTVSKDRIESRFTNLAPKRILMWTPIFGQYKNEMPACRELSDRCIVDHNRSMVASADAVLFHSKDITSHPLPDIKNRTPNQKYVFMTMETPENSGAYQVPSEIMALPKDYFHWLASFVLDSDVVYKYGSYFMTTKEAEKKGFTIESYHFNPKLLNKKKKGIIGFVSNCGASNGRQQVIKALEKYMDVTIGGKCANKEEYRNLCPPGEFCDGIIEEYPFYIAIENSDCNDYVTEKLWNRIKLVSIPIVMNRTIYEKINMPPKSFIAVSDYKNAKEMADHLNALQSNQTAYEEYFAWRMGDYTVAPWNIKGYRMGICDLCEKLWRNDTSNHLIHDIYTHYQQKASCTKSFGDHWAKQ